MKKVFKKVNAQYFAAALISLFIFPAIADDIEIYVGNAGVDVEVKPNLVFIIDTSGSMDATVNTPLPYDINTDYAASPYSGGCFDADRIYFSTGTTPTDCSTDDWFNPSALKCDATAMPMFNTVPPVVVVGPDVLISDVTVAKQVDDVEGVNLRIISSVYDAATDTTTSIEEKTEVKITGVNTTTKIWETTTTSTGPALGNGWYQDRIAQWKVNADVNREEWQNINNGQKDWFIECKADFGVHGETASGSKYIANKVDGAYTATLTKAADWNATSRGYVLYSGNYLNWAKVAPVDPNPPTRLDVVKDVTYSVVDSTNNINIGLMRFDSGKKRNGSNRTSYEGGSVQYPVQDVTTSRNDFKSRLKTMNYGGYTPLAETLYENYLYWGGKDVLFGNDASPTNNGKATGTGNSTYISPIKYTCQKNYNIYLSDGDATKDTDADALIDALDGVNGCGSGSTSNCMDELAKYMSTHDIYDGMDGIQTVTTYTVGFDINHDLLRKTAEDSGGKYYRANNAAELTQIFNKIIAEILSVNTTFSSPAVSINAFNRSTHRNELYFTLFKPNIGPHWNGNLKRFKLVFDADGLPSIIDFKGNSAINTKTGFFDDLAYSWWTDGPDADGGEVAKGGAAAHIAARKVYTYTGSTAPVNVDLTQSVHEFHEDNLYLTDTMLNITTADPINYRTKVVKWARGLDAYDDNGDGSTTDDRKIMGDPLHSEPALIQYDASYITDPSDPTAQIIDPDADPDITAYVATNDGVLHAIDTRSGNEIFSFIPKETLALQRVVAEDLAGSGKAYGIDGSINSLVIDEDSNGIINGNDKVYIFFGQRRGGNHYYAMDVSNRNKPILMWVINGGSGDFKNLAQSWSNIQVKKIKLNNKDKYVVVFGGGYDVDQDSVTSRTIDNTGNAVYIVDALGDSGGIGGGKRLWWASSDSTADLVLAEMKYSIPARLKAVDVRGDGYLDRMYVGDMGGQIWRFDIQKGEASGATLRSLVSAVRMADLGVSGSTAHNRRFYYPPDVAFIAEPDKPPYLALAVASGYRAHPLERGNQDRIYMIRDNYLFDKPPAGTYSSPIIEADLYDATANIIGQGSTADIKTAEVEKLNAAKGWYVMLNEQDGSFIGEKGLSEVLIIEGLVIASTYIPQDRATAGTKACDPADGKGRVYFMNLGDARPVYNFDTTVDDLTRDDRYQAQVGGGIPPGATPIFTEDGSAILVGTETVENPIDDTPKPMFWYEKK